MSTQALKAVQLGVGDMKDVITSLTPQEWAAPSACAGWSVQDLVAHLSSNFKETVDPTPVPPDAPRLAAERAMDALVDARRGWSSEQVREEYLGYCDQAVAVLASMQEEPLASTVIPLADLGHYPMHQLADAFAFDHYCHLRMDLVAPGGPVERTLPAPDGTRLGPTIGWMLAGLPQMQPDLHATVEVDRPLTLVLTGPGGGQWTIRRDGDVLVVDDSADPVVATIESDGDAFVRWGTTRTPWRDECQVSGDTNAAERFLDALNII